MAKLTCLSAVVLKMWLHATVDFNKCTFHCFPLSQRCSSRCANDVFCQSNICDCAEKFNDRLRIIPPIYHHCKLKSCRATYFTETVDRKIRRQRFRSTCRWKRWKMTAAKMQPSKNFTSTFFFKTLHDSEENKFFNIRNWWQRSGSDQLTPSTKMARRDLYQPYVRRLAIFFVVF